MADPDSSPSETVRKLTPYRRVGGIHQIEHLFRKAAGVDIDKSDVKRYYDFVDHKVRDLLLLGQAVASANDRDIVEPGTFPLLRDSRRVSILLRSSTWTSDWSRYLIRRSRGLRISTGLSAQRLRPACRRLLVG